MGKVSAFPFHNLLLLINMNYNRRVIRSIAELETVFDSFSPSLTERKTRDNRLERMKRLLAFLGNPEESFRTYHVAGSKGKGSTSAYLASLLTGYGRHCGLYTSPHLFTVRERFTLSGEFFADEMYINVCNKLLEKVSSFTLPDELGPERPTIFEMYTAYGYMLFKEAGCTDAVIETGMGGRLDATNTIRPVAVFLTPVELEHTDVLGDTIEKIATEKSKIIVPDVPVFVSRQREEAKTVFQKEASSTEAPIHFFDDEITDFRTKTDSDGEHTSFAIGGKSFSMALSMSTEAMAENAALAVLASITMGFYSDNGLKIAEKTQLPGRFEKRIIDGHLVVIDTAHTERSAKETAKAFHIISQAGRKTLILALAQGKNVQGVLSSLGPVFDRIIITRTGAFKKSNPEELFGYAKKLFPEKDVSLATSPDEALDSALALSSDILITGSFYLASEMRRLRKCYES